MASWVAGPIASPASGGFAGSATFLKRDTSNPFLLVLPFNSWRECRSKSFQLRAGN
jgi:hypothetical protein